MESSSWQLRYRKSGHGEVIEQRFHSEDEFRQALRIAYAAGGTDLVATTPEGRKLTEAVIRQRFPDA